MFLKDSCLIHYHVPHKSEVSFSFKIHADHLPSSRLSVFQAALAVSRHAYLAKGFPGFHRAVNGSLIILCHGPRRTYETRRIVRVSLWDSMIWGFRKNLVTFWQSRDKFLRVQKLRLKKCNLTV